MSRDLTSCLCARPVKRIAVVWIGSIPTARSEPEGAGNDRPPHMNVEAKPAFASGNIEIEAAVAEVQVPRWAEGIVDRPEHLPIDMRADAETADIAISGEPEAIAEVAVIAPADQRVGPAGGAVYRYSVCCPATFFRDISAVLFWPAPKGTIAACYDAVVIARAAGSPNAGYGPHSSTGPTVSSPPVQKCCAEMM